jgi:hypothetical protein
VLKVYEEAFYTLLLKGTAEEGGEDGENFLEGLFLSGGGLLIEEKF